jgi:two-component system, cell cycle response regulator DivK
MAGSDGAQPLVLLVDDTEDNRDVYAQYLTMSGFRVELAVDGVEAVEMAARLKPDVIVMDLAMPRLDGWEATRQIKAAPETSAIPVIALTGNAATESKRRAQEAGCSGYLTKPCLPDVLVSEIRRLV